MPRVNPEIARLRQEVKKRRSDVTRKERRIFNQTGVNIAGTREDPRRPAGIEKKMNANQLRHYLSQLDAFQARGNQYVAGANGVALPRNLYREYKRREKEVNEKNAKAFSELANLFLPTHGMTVEAAHSMRETTLPTAGGQNTENPYRPVNRQPKNIGSVEALNKLISDMNKRAKPSYRNDVIKQQRKDMDILMDRIGHPELKIELGNLTNAQFDKLVNAGRFGHRAWDIYHVLEMLGYGSKDESDDSDEREYGVLGPVMDDYESELTQLIDWSKTA